MEDKEDNFETIQKMVYRLDQIFVDDEKIKRAIATTVSRLPEEVIDFVEENVEFFDSDPECTALTINIEDLKNKHRNDKYIIFLDSNFVKASTDDQYYIVAHEIGHAYLKHENGGIDLSKEKEADAFAEKHGYHQNIYKNRER